MTLPLPQAVSLVHPDGTAITRGDVHRARAAANVGRPGGGYGGGFGRPAYAAADRHAPELRDYNPSRGSADSDLLDARGLLVAQGRDQANNHPFVAGGVDRVIDAVVGAGLILQSRPDHRALGITPEQAHELGSSIETAWITYTNDPGKYCDATRHNNMGGLMALAYRHWVVDGEVLAAVQWLSRPGWRYNTAVAIIDPDRLSNPQESPNGTYLRDGVALDRAGAAEGYHIRRCHPGDAGFIGAGVQDAWTWDYLPRETEWGRPIVLHHYRRDRAGQHRGKVALSTVIKQLCMLTRASELEMRMFVRDALMSGFVTSPYDPEDVEARLSPEYLSQYQSGRVAFHEASQLKMGDTDLKILYAGEQVQLLAPTRPASGFPAFVEIFLRHIAAALGISYEQLSNDWSKVNYSSARAALVEVWRGMEARRAEFIAGFVSPFYGAWLEEALELGDIPVPAGCRPYWECRAAWLNAIWIGPTRGTIDPLKEAMGDQIAMQCGATTLAEVCARRGLDYEAVLYQRAREQRLMQELGLPQPPWVDPLALAAAMAQPQMTEGGTV